MLFENFYCMIEVCKELISNSMFQHSIFFEAKVKWCVILTNQMDNEKQFGCITRKFIQIGLQNRILEWSIVRK